MARPRKTARYDADAATIKRFFEQSWGAREEQKAASGLISSINSEMEAAGVHPGVMSTMRKIKAMPDGKRGSTCSCCVATPTCSRKSCTTRCSPRRPRSQRRPIRSLSSRPREHEVVRVLPGAAGERQCDVFGRLCARLGAIDAAAGSRTAGPAPRCASSGQAGGS
jgi:hypothetical protein